MPGKRCYHPENFAFRVQTQKLAQLVYQQYWKLLPHTKEHSHSPLQCNAMQCSGENAAWYTPAFPGITYREKIYNENIQWKPTTEAKLKSKFSWILCSI